MNSGITGRFGASLGSWDREALAAVYPQLTPACEPPAILVTGHEGQHPNGSDIALSASSGGSGPIEHTWYYGLRGDRSRVMGSGPSVLLNDVTESFVFWVLAVGPCGFTETPSLELHVEFCDPAALVTVQRPSSVQRGASATLTAFASGELPVSYEWFDTDPSTGAQPIGLESTLVTVPLFEAATYWVRVSNRCAVEVSDPMTIGVLTQRRRGVRPPTR